jgi:hypothetical protein
LRAPEEPKRTVKLNPTDLANPIPPGLQQEPWQVGQRH